MLLGPSCCHFRTALEDIHLPEYKDLDVLLDDIAATYRKAVSKFYEADAVVFADDGYLLAYLCDLSTLADKEVIGQDPDQLIDKYADDARGHKR